MYSYDNSRRGATSEAWRILADCRGHCPLSLHLTVSVAVVGCILQRQYAHNTMRSEFKVQHAVLEHACKAHEGCCRCCLLCLRSMQGGGEHMALRASSAMYGHASKTVSAEVDFAI